MSIDTQSRHIVTTRRILVIGRSEAVLETVLQGLSDLGFEVDGTTEPEGAASAFDARSFGLVAIGGGIERPLREALGTAFRAQNPDIRLVDVSAPTAVRQIAEALGGGRDRPFVDLDAYRARIGYDGPDTPTIDTLRDLHERHLDSIAFEAVDVLLGRGVDLAEKAIDAKLIAGRRGGYCFEQNSLFKRVLARMGFAVEGLAARVLWMAPPDAPVAPRTHMALRVTLDGRPWLVDVGFGSSVPPAPLRMDTEEPQRTLHDTYRIIPFGPALLAQVWRNGGWRAMYELSPEPCQPADYELANWYTSTHPDSPFRRSLTVARTRPEARHALLDNRLTLRRPDGTVEQHVLNAAGLERALEEVFGLAVEPSWREVIERATMEPSPAV